MSATIGELNVGVGLDLSRLDADTKVAGRKIKAQWKQLDAELARMPGAKAFGFGGGYGSGYGRSRGGASAFNRSADGGMGLGGVLMKAGGRLAGNSLGGALGVGGGVGGALAGAGPVGAAIAGTAALVKFRMTVGDWAKESTRIDDNAIAAADAGETTRENLKKFWQSTKDVAINAVGFVRNMEMLVGTGFDPQLVNASNEAGRGAKVQEANLARLRAMNDPKQLASIRRQLKEFQRNQGFAAASPKGQQEILRNEIKSLKTQEAKARASKLIVEAENLRLERLEKEAELQKNITQFTEAQKANYEAIDLARNERMDREDEKRREREAEHRKEWDDALNEISRDIYTERLGNVKDRMGSIRNPFESAGVSGFGSASSAGSLTVQEGNRLLAQQLTMLRNISEGIEDMIKRL